MFHQKSGSLFLAISLPNANRFSKFFTIRKATKFPTTHMYKISLHLGYVVTLPYETQTFESGTNSAEITIKSYILKYYTQMIMLFVQQAIDVVLQHLLHLFI